MLSFANLKAFVKAEIVMVISLVLAVVSVFAVPPDGEYLGYIDFRTLAILLSLMLIMAGLQKLYVFRQIGEFLITRVSTERVLAIVLVVLCFLFSMFITNDVALLTFVPFTIVVLHMAKANRRLISVIVLETIAANLGSMMTPMGNPQNLYLYSLTSMSLPEFIGLMLPYGAASLVILLILTVCMTSGSKISLELVGNYTRTPLEKRRMAMYLALFVISLAVVARFLDYRIGLVLVLICVILFDRGIMRNADYSLLLTFIFLFIFIGNMKRIPSVNTFLSGIVFGHEVYTAIAASQVISNVPAAILLSGFTDNIQGLIIGTNLGGLGTLIASMASLISFKQYGHAATVDKKKYLIVFTGLNILVLALLIGLQLILS